MIHFRPVNFAGSSALKMKPISIFALTTIIANIMDSIASRHIRSSLYTSKKATAHALTEILYFREVVRRIRLNESMFMKNAVPMGLFLRLASVLGCLQQCAPGLPDCNACFHGFDSDTHRLSKRQSG